MEPITTATATSRSQAARAPGKAAKARTAISTARDTIDAGADAQLACDLVGWTDLQMLKRYRILSKKDRERAVKLRADYRRDQRKAAQLALPFTKKSGG